MVRPNFKRLLVIMLGMVCAFLAGAIIVKIVLILTDTTLDFSEMTLIGALLDFIDQILLIAVFGGSIVILPVSILAYLAEKFSWHAFSLYGVLGIFIGVSAIMIFADNVTLLALAMGAVTGFVGATIYWLIAGRNAGMIRQN